MTNKRLSVIVSAIALVGLLAWIFVTGRNPLSEFANDPQIEPSSVSTSVPADTHRELSSESDQILETDTERAAESQEALKLAMETRREESDELLLRQGYVDWPTVHPDYLGYDDATLKKLANGGDEIAQVWLATKLTYSDPEDAVRLFRQAALRGSTYSIVQIAQINRKRASGELLPEGYYKGMNEDSGEVEVDPTPHLVESLAWAFVAGARGDAVGVGFGRELIRDWNLNTEQIADACSTFNNYYEQLESDRAALGLTEFDNSPLPLATVNYQTAAAQCDEWPTAPVVCTPVDVQTTTLDTRAFFCDKTTEGRW